MKRIRAWAHDVRPLEGVLLVTVLVLLLAMPAVAFGRVDRFGGGAYVEPYAPYTAGPVVREDFRQYAPYTAGPVVREEFRQYAPYTAGPVVRETRPYAPYTAGPVVPEEQKFHTRFLK